MEQLNNELNITKCYVFYKGHPHLFTCKLSLTLSSNIIKNIIIGACWGWRVQSQKGRVVVMLGRKSNAKTKGHVLLTNEQY